MAPRRVYFAVFGSGLGHVTRILEISRRLPGSEARYSTSGQGLTFLVSRGMRSSVEESPHLDVDWSPGGGFSSHKVLPRLPFMFSTFQKQVAFERNSMARFRPSVVVSDSRLSAVFAGRSLGLPVVTMLNQFKILFPPRFRREGMGEVYERIAGDSLGLMWSLSDRVLITDLPPPYTIGEANVTGTGVSNVVEFVGFTTPDHRRDDEDMGKVKARLGVGKRPLVYCQVSGPEATKGRLEGALLKAAGAITGKYDLVISMGRSEGSTEPRRIGEGGWLFDWCPVKDELFELADVIVSRAGLSTMAQCVEHGKPGVMVPIHNHSEQIANAEKFSRLGLGVEIRSERLTPAALASAIDDVVGDPRYREKVASVRRVSERYNGVEKCVEIIRSYS